MAAQALNTELTRKSSMLGRILLVLTLLIMAMVVFVF